MNIKFLNKIRYAFNLKFEQQVWVVYFFAASFFVWLTLRFTTMQTLANMMGESLENRQACSLADKNQVKTASIMGSLMQKVARNVPWGSQCMAQALCVKWLLNRYKIPSVFYLGALIESPNQTMKAHAWIDVKQQTIIGAPQHKNYHIVGTFITFSFN